MKNMILTLSIMGLLAACSHSQTTTETAPVAEPKVEALSPAVHVNLKAIKGKKMNGMIHFTQADANVKAELMLEGLKAGPYNMHLVESCKKVSSKHSQNIGSVMIGKKGMNQEVTSFSATSTQDLVGKAIVLNAQSKKSSKPVACGIVEKM